MRNDAFCALSVGRQMVDHRCRGHRSSSTLREWLGLHRRAVRDQRSVNACRAWLEDEQAQEQLKESITNVLGEIFDKHAEVPFMAMYRKQVNSTGRTCGHASSILFSRSCSQQQCQMTSMLSFKTGTYSGLHCAQVAGDLLSCRKGDVPDTTTSDESRRRREKRQPDMPVGVVQVTHIHAQ